MKQKRHMAAVLLLLAGPSLAQANAGTPMMLATGVHLLFGNLIIGLIEGLLLAKVFGVSMWRCIGLLIVANYFSAWCGLFGMQGIAHVLPMGLHSGWLLLWLLVVITYMLTLLLEFSFVAFAFRGDPSWRRKSIRGSLLIQTVSYAILFGWYWLPSRASLYTRTDVVEVSSMSLPQSVLVYFLSVDDGSVNSGSLRERQWRRVLDLHSSHRNDRLFVRPSAQDPNLWDLVARLETDGHREPNFVTVEGQLATVAVPSRGSTDTDPPRYDGTWFNFGPAPKLGDAQSSSWEFRSGFWPGAGLYGAESNSRKRVSFAFETPYIAWSARNLTHLPTDKVLLQLGKDQICVYDPLKNQIALLARGRGPIAVMESPQDPDHRP